jgi:apolipoprotein D and lipocalin family protein
LLYKGSNKKTNKFFKIGENKMKKLIIAIAFLTSMASYGTGPTDMPTPNYVDVEQYVGKWYTVSTLPQFFSGRCAGQTAEYEIIGEGTISVLNTCIKKSGKTRTIEGQASVTNKNTNAELVVTFNNFFTKLFKVKGEYVIIKLDENYEYVMVGSSNRKSLWIMSRTPSMPEAVLSEYVALAKSLGFNTDKLKISTKF